MEPKPPLDKKSYNPAKIPVHQSGDIVAIRYKEGSYRFVCCDCGLAHLLSFEIEGSTLLMNVRRDEAATTLERRYLKRKEAEAQAGEGGSPGVSK